MRTTLTRFLASPIASRSRRRPVIGLGRWLYHSYSPASTGMRHH